MTEPPGRNGRKLRDETRTTGWEGVERDGHGAGEKGALVVESLRIPAGLSAWEASPELHPESG